MSHPTPPPEIIPFGDAAWLLRFSPEGSPDAPYRLWRCWQTQPPAGLVEAIPASDSVLVIVDPSLGNREQIQQCLLSCDLPSTGPEPEHAEVEIPTVYGGECGPDLEEVARCLGITAEEVVERHAGRSYRVLLIGFTPGFPYLGPLDPTLEIPRRVEPRPFVPAGSVGIAGNQTGIYPQDGPGGWHIIGRTPQPLFFPDREPPILLNPGDRVRFLPVPQAHFPQPRKTPLEKQRKPLLEVLQPGWLSSVQDLGRYGGYQALGIAPAGALDRVSLAMANRAAGNPPGAAALEITGKGPVLRALGRVHLAWAGGEFAVRLNGIPIPAEVRFSTWPGDTLDMGIALTGWRCYLAVEGGWDVPLILGSRSTHIRAGLGGLGGRALRRGDILGGLPTSGDRGSSSLILPPGPIRWRERLQSQRKTLRVLADKRLAQGSLAAAIRVFDRGEYTVEPQSDRMGLRLRGEPLPVEQPPNLPSQGVSHGTIQVNGNGQLIILLNERGTTGGYPCLGAVAQVDHWLLGQLRPGDRMRFKAITLAEAQRLRAPDPMNNREIAEIIQLALASHLEFLDYSEGPQRLVIRTQDW